MQVAPIISVSDPATAADADIVEVMSTRRSDMPGHTDGVVPVGLRFELFVDDVEQSVDFYKATLGFAAPPQWSPEDYVSMHAGVVAIGIQRHANLPNDHHFTPARLSGPRGVGLEIVIEVDDIDAAHTLAHSEAARHHGQIEPPVH